MPAPFPVEIDIHSDNICPWCLIARTKLEQAMAAAGDEFKFTIRWHPYFIRPNVPADGLPRNTSAAATSRRLQALETHARAVGIKLVQNPVVPNTLPSHRLLHRAATVAPDKQDALACMILQAALCQGVNISLRENLVEIARQAGLDAEETAAYLATDEDAALVREQFERTREEGLMGVPNVVLNGRVTVPGAQEPGAFVRVFRRLKERGLTPLGGPYARM